MDKKQAPKPTLARSSSIDAAKTPPNDARPAAFAAFAPIKNTVREGNEEGDEFGAGKNAAEAMLSSSVPPQDDTGADALDDIPPLIFDVHGHASRHG